MTCAQIRLALACVAIGLGSVPADAQTGPDRVSVHLGSAHLGARRSFEAFNPGLFLTWERGGADLSVGVYRNSFGKGSVAATAAVPIARLGEVTISPFLGVAYYPDDGRRFRASVGDVVPLAGIRASYRNVFVQLMPGDPDLADAVVSFGFSMPLN